MPPTTPPYDFEVVFMDAGHGDCTLIAYPDGALTLVDCGSTKSGNEAFAQILAVLSRYLPRNGNAIDNLVLTHPDVDHYNKVLKLVQASGGPSVGWVYFSGNTELYGAKMGAWLRARVKAKTAGPPPNTFSVTPDARLSRPGVSGGPGVDVTILAGNAVGPLSSKNGPIKNGNSIVLMVEHGPGKLFLMGDATKETEDHILGCIDWNDPMESQLLGPGGAEQVVLRVGHHGSESSTGDAWLGAVQPNLLVVSAGTKRFGGTGMPSATKAASMIAGAKRLFQNVIPQSYVVFDAANGGTASAAFAVQPKTPIGFWATCYDVQWDGARWQESGQTWYYIASPTQGGKSTQVMYGYTGYEEKDDGDED